MLDLPVSTHCSTYAPAPGSLVVGEAGVTVHTAQADQTIGVGLTSKDMHIGDGEVGRVTALQGLTIGSSANGSITVNGMSDANTAAVGTITLLALNQAKIIKFESDPSYFNKGIFVRGQGGVNVETSVTTKNTPTALNAGTGSITVAAGATLSTTQQLLTITTNGLDIVGKIETDSGSMQISTPQGLSMGVGSTTEQVTVLAEHLLNLDTAGLTIGQLGVNGNIRVGGLTKLNTDGVHGIVSLVATTDDSQIVFDGSHSTFGMLAVQADNGVLLKA